MKISLPPAKWNKAVGKIEGMGTSGHDWKPKVERRTGSNDGGFVSGTVNAEPGDLFVCFNVGNQATEGLSGIPIYNGPTVLAIAIPIRGSLVYVATARSDASWSSKLLLVAKTLLSMSAKSRILFGLDLRMNELTSSIDRGPAAMAAISEVTEVRQKYLSQLRLPVTGSGHDAWVIAAFECFILEQSSYLNTSKDRILATLQEHYEQLDKARFSTGRNPQRALPAGGRRNLQLRTKDRNDD